MIDSVTIDTACNINAVVNHWCDLTWDALDGKAVKRSVFEAWAELTFARKRLSPLFDLVSPAWPRPTTDAIALASACQSDCDNVAAMLVLADALDDSGGEWCEVAADIRRCAPLVLAIMARPKKRKRKARQK